MRHADVVLRSELKTLTYTPEGPKNGTLRMEGMRSFLRSSESGATIELSADDTLVLMDADAAVLMARAILEAVPAEVAGTAVPA